MIRAEGRAREKTYQIDRGFGAGVGVQLLGIKVPGLGSEANPRTPYDQVITEPPGLNCRV